MNKGFGKSGKALKKKYDKQGKKVAIEIVRDLFNAKLVIENIKEDNGDFSDGIWDLEFITEYGKTFKVEPEIKVDRGEYWSNQYSEYNRPFKFLKMDIPFRKDVNLADYHIVIDNYEEFAWIVSKAVMKKCIEESGIKYKPTMYEANGAYFTILTDRGIFVENVDSLWKRWKPKSI